MILPSVLASGNIPKLKLNRMSRVLSSEAFIMKGAWLMTYSCPAAPQQRASTSIAHSERARIIAMMPKFDSRKPSIMARLRPIRSERRPIGTARIRAETDGAAFSMPRKSRL
jgi:hypothetical protein